MEEKRVTRFKSMALALKELEPFIRNGQHLQTGRGFDRFGDLRSRELLCNWLLCAVKNFEFGGERFVFSSDPTGGDGLVTDLHDGHSWFVENVMVPNLPGENDTVDGRILAAIAHKQSRGAEYADGKELIVFANAGKHEAWYPNRIARQIVQPQLFDSIWIMSLQVVENGEYVYGVAALDISQANCPCFIITIASDFNTWTVRQIQ
jgi:hypothetical protein